MSSNKHIVWLLPGFASSAEDDSCIPPLLELLEYVSEKEKVKISVIALQYPFVSEKYQIHGMDIHPMNGKNKWFNKWGVWKKTMKTLNELHQIQPINLVHSFWLGDAALIGQAFTAQKNMKHICTLMGQDVLRDNRHLNNKRLTKLTTIALSTFQAEIYFRNTKKRVDAVIPFGIPIPEIDYPKKQYDIIGAGSLIPVKNYEMWIEVIAAIKRKKPNIKAILCGDGDEKTDLKALIEKYDLGTTIELAGQKKRKEVLNLMSESRLFLHTAKHEGQGYVFMEAMNKGLPILSTPVGYALENEKIWKGTDPEKFAEEAIHILRNPDFRVRYQYPDVKETFKKYWAYYKRT